MQKGLSGISVFVKDGNSMIYLKIKSSHWKLTVSSYGKNIQVPSGFVIEIFDRTFLIAKVMQILL
ncbi:MAG: hypothetical protein IPH77_10750 [Ignavibacteria bacterium]|nr:hypothetical protein [Ignavibacteria bacterium]